MEKNGGKVIAIVALVIAIVALSVGFAAFADQLTIEGQATAAAPENPFDDADAGLNYKSGTAKCVKTGTTDNVITGAYSAGDLIDDSWAGINVPLNKDVPSVTCTATVENNTAYVAYLRSLAANRGVRCSSIGTNADTNADNVCNTVTVTVSIDSDTLTINGPVTPTTNSSTTSAIAANSTKDVTVVISYEATAVTDEDVTISLPTITHDYSSAAR